MFEYQMAQEMLRHYDNLNWLIGTILIGGTLVLTGIVISSIDKVYSEEHMYASLIISLGVPALTFVILKLWIAWFDRHRSLYNKRCETMHRIEEQLGLFHWLLVEAEREIEFSPQKKMAFNKAREESGHSEHDPYYKRIPLPTLTGHETAHLLRKSIPRIQLIILMLIWFVTYWDKICNCN